MSFQKEVYTPEETKTHKSSPRLARMLEDFIYENAEDWPVYDFGCGNGYYLNRISREMGKQFMFGIEGSTEIHDQKFPYIIHPIDIATPALQIGPMGTVLCFEVLEHVHGRRIPCVLANLERHCKGWMFISWAIPGQKGLRHVSCVPPDLAIRHFYTIGFDFQEELSMEFREEAGKDLWWFKESIYVFRRRK